MLNIPRILLTIGWNRRPLTWDDFEALCAHLKIEIQRAPIITPGMYFLCRDQPIISLSTKLYGVRLWLVGWHELAHHLLHAPGLRCYSPGSVSKCEAEAELIGHYSVLDESTLTGIISRGDLHDYPCDVIKRRLRMVDRHGC
jgi:Zn-dependent peptidase ImmA (M78 family)